MSVGITAEWLTLEQRMTPNDTKADFLQTLASKRL
jgi:hypothetical protein